MLPFVFRISLSFSAVFFCLFGWLLCLSFSLQIYTFIFLSSKSEVSSAVGNGNHSNTGKKKDMSTESGGSILRGGINFDGNALNTQALTKSAHRRAVNAAIGSRRVKYCHYQRWCSVQTQLKPLLPLPSGGFRYRRRLSLHFCR